MPSVGRANFNSVEFFILGDEDVAREACGVTNNKSLFSEGVPVANGIYDPHYGTTDLGWKCQTCFQGKMDCPGHDGMMVSNYSLQSPMYRKEILKWLRITCHKCKEFVIKKELPASLPSAAKLGEMVKQVRSGNEKHRKCAHCDAPHPWISKDPMRHGVIWREWFNKGVRNKSEQKEIMYNHEIKAVLSGIPDQNVLKMGKTLMSHPAKLMIKNGKVSSTVIRPEIRKIGGNRSAMADTSAHLRTFMELNGSVPKEIPKDVDADLHAKLVLLDLTFFEMIQGSSATTKSLALMTNTNKISNSIAARLPKKHGRLRANLMGKRTTKMARSVITGDKALRPDQLGVPLMIARNMFVPETVRPWNRDRLTTYFLNGPHQYPGCNQIERADTGFKHYVESMSKDYVLQEGDIVHRHMITGDQCGFNREPALLYCSIAMLSAKVISGFTLRINSAVCVLFNADFDKQHCRKQVAAAWAKSSAHAEKQCKQISHYQGFIHPVVRAYNYLVSKAAPAA
jgi:DNA-directed RNA polymerase beta' subunit